MDPLTLKQIQTEVLDERTILVPYFVTDEQIIAFVVSQDALTAISTAITHQDLVDRVTAFRSLIPLEAESPADRLAQDRSTATHAELNSTSPLFSALYLTEGPTVENQRSLERDEGLEVSPVASKSDGRLEVYEIFNLDLTEANGVILSACETELGEQSREDEMVGLTRAFLHAGTPVVVASLWEVEDEATSQPSLRKRLY